MILRETVDFFGKSITRRYKSGSYCGFAPAEETVGFIDTSAAQDGSRGIVFMCDRLRVNFSGRVVQAYYSEITEVQPVFGYEGAYSDELVICTREQKIRVCDYSLNKLFLLQLIETLRRQYLNMSEEERDREYTAYTTSAAEHFAGQISASLCDEIPESDSKCAEDTAVCADMSESAPQQTEGAAEYICAEREAETVSAQAEPVETDSAPAEIEAAPAETVPAEIQDEPAEKSSDATQDEPAGNTQPEAEPTPADIAPQTGGNADVMTEVTEDDIDLTDLEEMTHEETMSYLLDSISEINAAQDIIGQSPHEDAEDTAAAADSLPQTAPEHDFGFTAEPEWDDLYIQASRKLREICESGRLTHGQIEAALRESLIPAASTFSELSANSAGLPEMLRCRVEQLKAASGSMDKYFALGEDIAERVMFFMLYQMLSYSDRIAENAETKERLNDFFRHYGPSGITLSMLDTGIYS